MNSVNIMGVEVSNVSRAEALARVQNALASQHQHYIVTPNPEIVLAAGGDPALRSVLNHADLSLPDGFGLKIAARILGVRLPNRIAGADFMEMIVALAEEEHWPLFLLGGRDAAVPQRAAERLRGDYPAVVIAGHASGGVVRFREGRWEASEPGIIEKINQSGASILFVGFGAPKQEKWIFSNLDKLPNVRLAMVVGGTIDFWAGLRRRAPLLLRAIGLEWLWRLVLEPQRAKRIWNATGVFLWTAMCWRFRMTFAYRENVAACIINKKGEALVVRRAREKEEHWQLPQGGAHSGERPEDAVLREMFEELGTKSFEIIGHHPKTYRYDWPEWHRLNGGYKGQTQTLFYLRYTGDANGIRLDQHELSHYRWVRIDTLVASVHENRKSLARMAVEGYARLRGTKISN